MWRWIGVIAALVLLRALMLAMVPVRRRRSTHPVSTMVVLGSGEPGFCIFKDGPQRHRSAPGYSRMMFAHAGGHTAEMLKLLGSLQPEQYTPRRYVVAATDAMGAAKAQAFEQQLQQRMSRQVP